MRARMKWLELKWLSLRVLRAVSRPRTTVYSSANQWINEGTKTWTAAIASNYECCLFAVSTRTARLAYCAAITVLPPLAPVGRRGWARPPDPHGDRGHRWLPLLKKVCFVSTRANLLRMLSWLPRRWVNLSPIALGFSSWIFREFSQCVISTYASIRCPATAFTLVLSHCPFCPAF